MCRVSVVADKKDSRFDVTTEERTYKFYVPTGASEWRDAIMSYCHNAACYDIENSDRGNRSSSILSTPNVTPTKQASTSSLKSALQQGGGGTPLGSKGRTKAIMLSPLAHGASSSTGVSPASKAVLRPLSCSASTPTNSPAGHVTRGSISIIGSSFR